MYVSYFVVRVGEIFPIEEKLRELIYTGSDSNTSPFLFRFYFVERRDITSVEKFQKFRKTNSVQSVTRSFHDHFARSRANAPRTSRVAS